MTEPRPRVIADPNRLQIIRQITRVEFSPAADLHAAAEEVGVAVADLVALRRKLGTAPRHRRPSRWTRLFRKG